jgi:hypothetical protein
VSAAGRSTRRWFEAAVDDQRVDVRDEAVLLKAYLGRGPETMTEPITQPGSRNAAASSRHLTPADMAVGDTILACQPLREGAPEAP